MIRICVLIALIASAARAASTESALMDWSYWEHGRPEVKHPCLSIKPADVDRARGNIARHAWAREYANGVEARAQKYVDQLTTEFVMQMIPSTTPISSIFTPCPACRDKKLPYLSHGVWEWSPETPEQLQCTQCKTVFPNEQYPETEVLQSEWDPSQRFSFFGGETFPIFAWKNGRPSFSGNVRARKIMFAAELAHQMAEAYTLTGKAKYAAGCRKLLLRFAAVYPKYMLHSAYGEIADMNPREALLSIDKLLRPELVYPPNPADRKLHVGFWAAGRATGTGIEGVFATRCAESYDLTCGAKDSSGEPVYSKADQIAIERDLLLETTYFGTCDPNLNNKSVSNRTAAGIVGLCVGHALLARFGIEAVRATIDDWFLPDGSTPESPAYAMMALGGIREAALALRDYSDPANYADPTGKRLDHFDIYKDTALPHVWRAQLNCLQGDLKMPPFADSYRKTDIAPSDAEILNAVYPDQAEWSVLLHEYLARDATAPAVATYLRNPEWDSRSPSQHLTLTDNCMPDLRIGFMRTGQTGRESLLLLSASHWGSHHHDDSLNLYYWKQGTELLTDLGYLWDHPDREMTIRTFAHNTVLIDEKEQTTRERGGDVEYFRTSEHMKVMCASSHAYSDAKTYRRTSALVDHGQGRSYAVDFFQVQGGATQDYVYHGPGAAREIRGIQLVGENQPVYDLKSVRASAETSGGVVWRATFDAGTSQTLVAWNLLQSNEKVFIGDGWGQRDWKNTDRGVTIPYVVRRCNGSEPKTFVSVFEGAVAGREFVTNVERLAGADGAVKVRVETRSGTDEFSLPKTGGVLSTILH